MKYVSAMLLGLIAAGLSAVAFSFAASYSPLLNYLIAVEGLNSNSLEWLLVILQDSAITLLNAVAIFFIYRRLLSQFPFNWLAIILMQLPLSLLVISVNGLPIDFANLYELSKSLPTLINAIAIVLIYVVFKLFDNKQATINSGL
ncbi:hypothetical protein TUM4438_23960 [Shewanella sairae]|uniref:DUF2569 domain-containing protein n=1 Tax=Shewanella sairae TaxID=190310 RepID=A0ABQ4PIE4_9GAMM|nr:hypothetical protein [Shewanella sairae]MCL1131232.1 hypothetical protein [Shewanella sairae]GIU46871.1 hypothetical protein TUM4438_23960 [Shewanella sairae]